ncbi:unnamed protein product [Phyllotreta striolata]|uniref:Odorant receptor n=1 Tax=Phyllotreta striolata TaxID=444603 RepID=A0A9N9XMX3_PHYSR|nr:unnamed protein product [Phyllotreta striolata]
MMEIYVLSSDLKFNIFLDILVVLIIATGHLVKIVIFKVKTKVWLDIFDQLKSPCFNDYPEEFEYNNRRHVNFSKNFGNLFQFSCCWSTGMMIFQPLFSNVDLPMNCSFVTEPFIPYMYAGQVMFILLCAFSHSSIDVLITDLIGIIVGQLDVLGEKIKAYDTNKTKEKIDLKQCVQHHVEIIKFVNNLRQATSVIILIEYVKSALVVCFLGVQAVHIDPMSLTFLKMPVYLIVMLFQLLIYCFFANKIIDKTQEIGDACYFSMWYSYKNTCDKRSLILIMERSKRPLYLTAGKIYVVSLQSFTDVLNSSYTYFTLMQSLYGKNYN